MTKHFKHLFVVFFIAFFTSSCADVVTNWHKQFDAQDQTMSYEESNGTEGYSQEQYDAFKLYRKNNASERNTNNTKNLSPQTKRKYFENSDATNSLDYRNAPNIDAPRKRYQADDLVDSKNNASLWAGQGKDNYLFSAKTEKKRGDILLVKVKKVLKNEITSELKRAYPDAPPPQQQVADGDKQDAASDTKAPPPPAPEAPKEDDANEDPAKIYDRISCVIVDEISSDHLLLRGIKQIIYKERKRSIEFQGLISRKDLADDDSIDSDKLLETQIKIMR